MSKIMCTSYLSGVLILAWMSTMAAAQNSGSHNYADALSKCLMFFEGQRSGKLPPSQRITWRKDSGLKDGSDVGMDLVGGYYDAGDNVKFNFPMAFTTTMLSWSVLEFGQLMGSELPHALEAIRWGSDYLLKSTSVPDSVVGVVGDPNGDHTCWERPEDMTTPRTTYVVNKEKPGSEVAAETAAALAASSMVFKDSDKFYSASLLNRSIQVFEFADKYRGSYNDSIGEGACPFTVISVATRYTYDELLWGAAWLYKATKIPQYWDYVKNNIQFGTHSSKKYKWHSCCVLNGDVMNLDGIQNMPASTYLFLSGLLFKPGGSNLQHSTSLSFLLMAYAGYMKASNKVIDCGNNFVVTPASLVNFTKGQVDYILGSNPLGMSYMVGYGKKFPQKIHHRGSVNPSMENHLQQMQCHEGDLYFKSTDPNPNILVGAIVGGPAEDDTFEDSRSNVQQSEPTTYINAPFVGVLANFLKG
ncbi:unnamed protein product [Prunus armeniaca]|uniref:Endoglucanase n=1 Tax=Prunus armeniaca TaxID=36596 RepID=A0A6J5TZX3_PRUAR|nr:unnamed protein product [Prunus armeniaca]